MTTLEPLTETELHELQAQWMSGISMERRACPSAWPSTIRTVSADPLGEDWTAEQPPFPERWFDSIDKLAAEHKKDIEEHANYLRHTVDIDRNPMSVEDGWKPPSVWKCLVALAIVVVFGMGCWAFAKWVAHR